MKNWHPEPFRTFWQAGYECADHLNCFGHRVDLLHTTGHEICAGEDYRLLGDFDIATVREGIRWSQVEQQPGVYDWAEVANRIQTAREHGIQQIWDLCHFGYPTDLSPLHPHFTGRFAALCRSFVQCYRSLTDEPLLVIPINEMSFISWLGGEVKGTVPYCRQQGFEVKYHLAMAFIAGAKAIRELEPDAVILSSEPLIYVANPLPEMEMPDLNEYQFQAMDMITGRMCPELGGSPGLVDVMGTNFYYDSQWAHGQGRLRWEYPRDARWQPLSGLLLKLFERYRQPVFISETSHLGCGRGEWILHIAAEARRALLLGVPLTGICLYPIIDRPDWDFPERFHNSGLWDLGLVENGPPVRLLCKDYADDLRSAQLLLQQPEEKNWLQTVVEKIWP